MAFGLPAGLESFAAAGQSLLTADAYSLLSGIFGTPRWGIFLYGVPVVIADSVTAFDLDKEWTISNFPVEKGAFLSYNKVYQPFRGTFRFTSGGSESNRQLLLSSVEAIAPTTELYDIVTPEMVYPSVSILGYDYSRKANSGMGLVSVDLRVEQVRDVGATSLSSTSSPNNAPQVNGGPVKATAPGANVPPATAVAPLAPIAVTVLG